MVNNSFQEYSSIITWTISQDIVVHSCQETERSPKTGNHQVTFFLYFFFFFFLKLTCSRHRTNQPTGTIQMHVIPLAICLVGRALLWNTAFLFLSRPHVKGSHTERGECWMPFFSASNGAGLEIATGWFRAMLWMFMFSSSGPEISQLPFLPFPHGLHEKLDTLFCFRF